MNYHYKEHIEQLIANMQLDFRVEVDEEQAFLKIKDLDPDTIYVVIKYLSNDIELGAITQPVQFLILSQQGNLETVKEIFGIFARTNNFVAYEFSYEESGQWYDGIVKQTYTEPVVLSNFNSVEFGYRSVLYMSATLSIIDKIMDLKNLKIDGKHIKALSFNISYSMSPNTQQKNSEFIAKSTKSTATMSISLVVPSLNNDFIEKVLGIVNETDEQETGQTDNLYGGNENFEFDFYIGSVHFGYEYEEDSTTHEITVIRPHKYFKLTTFAFGSEINGIPTLQLGFIK